ncbi:unnamed protein product [Lota lota]
MVSKEPNQLITGHTNSKSTLADKLPGTMTVRSVLLNRDSPDIESRLKRRRNRTHQVRFKDLEDGSSSSSGNSGTAESKSQQKGDCGSPYPPRKQSSSSRVHRGWADRDGPGCAALPGRTSVVGAVRGDMAGTIEVVAAFLARAPPHPLTPGPTRRCWIPPQANSLTLPMTRKSSTSTSTAIQTSPCLKKPQSHSPNRTGSYSLRDSVGVDGDDEQDSQDEYLTNNRGSSARTRKDFISPETQQQTVVMREAKTPRSDSEASVALVRNTRHGCPLQTLRHTEPCYCSSVSCRDGSRRLGSTTPSLVRRRKRLNRAISDPGKEVSFCTTPTQTDSPTPLRSLTKTQVCTTEVQTQSPCHSPPLEQKHCPTKRQILCSSPFPVEKHSSTQSPTKDSCPSLPPEQKHCTIQSPMKWSCPCPPRDPKHCKTQVQTESPCPSPPPEQKHNTTQCPTKSVFSSSIPDEKPCTTQIPTKKSGQCPLRNPKHCTTQVQTDTPCQFPSFNQKHSPTQSPTKSVVPSFLDEKPCTTQSPTKSSWPSLPLDQTTYTAKSQVENHHPVYPSSYKQCNTPEHIKTPFPDPSTSQPCSTKAPINNLVSSLDVTKNPSSTVIQPENLSMPSTSLSPVQCHEPHSTKINTVPYLPTPPSTITTTLTPQSCAISPCPPSAKPACSTPSPTPLAPPPGMPCPTAALILDPKSVPYYTVVSPLDPAKAGAVCFSPSTITCLEENATASESNMRPSTSISWSTITPSAAPHIIPNGPTIALPTGPNEKIPAAPLTNQPSNNTPQTHASPCTFVTQTGLSCTSISYYTTTHPTGLSGLHSSSTLPPYATVIQTVSHCKIPCQSGQISAANPGMTPYSSPVPKLKSCTSPPLLIQTYASTLHSVQSCTTPSKTAPLYSSTFRAAPPYTPPSQDKRAVRLPPPPPPPPPPYTPRKEDSITPGAGIRPTTPGAGCNEKEREKENRQDSTETKSPHLCRRASSLKHRAPTPPVSVIKEEKQSYTLPAKACSRPSCLSSAQAQLGALHKMLCSGANTRSIASSSQQALPPSQQDSGSGSGGQPTAGPLTATQAETLRQVQEILGGLVSGARCKLDPSRVAEKLLGPNGPLHDIRTLQTQLQSLEGVLETSQNTIKVLLDVIQDLEKKEAERDGRHSYRTGQDIENCGTCRDCACIIYSVEHDFRLQEGQVVRKWKVGDPPEGSPQSTANPPTQPGTPHRQDSPQPAQQQQPPGPGKKNRKKCFWFL